MNANAFHATTTTNLWVIRARTTNKWINILNQWHTPWEYGLLYKTYAWWLQVKVWVDRVRSHHTSSVFDFHAIITRFAVIVNFIRIIIYSTSDWWTILFRLLNKLIILTHLVWLWSSLLFLMMFINSFLILFLFLFFF